MKLLKITLFARVYFFIFLIIILSSCTFDNEEDLLKDFTCDTTDVSYHDLTYIFSDICANCHNETFTYREEIKMDNYENVKSSINTGLVWPAINHESGVPPMPNGLPKLSDCDLAKIQAWIDAGMPENK
ncbi:MAG: hypothetical protein R6V23_16900 [Bacteroidales bacterium]